MLQIIEVYLIVFILEYVVFNNKEEKFTQRQDLQYIKILFY